MKNFTNYLVILLFLISCSSENNKQKTDSDSVEKNAICIWDNAGIRDIPSKSGKWLASLALGEKVSLMGHVEVDSADNNREFYKIKLSDNSEGWVQSYLIVPDGKVAITKEEAKIYKRADLLTGTNKSFEKMDMLVIISEKGEWMEVLGKKRVKSGWVKSDNITSDPIDVSFAILAGKALAIKDHKKQSESLNELIGNPDFESSIFYYYLKAKLDPFSVEKVVEVNNINQFINAIGSNTKIIVNAQQLNLDQADVTIDDHVSTEWGLDIMGISNLIITSYNENSAKLLTANELADVINFSNCKNIYINNIIAGHSPMKGACDAGVFRFFECSNVHINNSELYGSGVFGLEMNKVKDFLIENSTIKECTYQIVYAEESSGLKFISCEFLNNVGPYLFNLENSTNVIVSDCQFSNNVGSYVFNFSYSTDIQINECTITANSRETEYYEEGSSLFYVSEESEAKAINCYVSENTFDSYITGEGVFEEYNNEITNNDFAMEQYYEDMEEEYYQEEGDPDYYEDDY